MATTITVRDDVYKKLARMKGNMSFSELLERLARKADISRFFGALANELTDKDLKWIMDERKRARART